MLTVNPAKLNFNCDNVPYSTSHEDPYFSLNDGINESFYVFIAGNHLQQRWKDLGSHTEHFTIAELGFGFGVNFLCTFQKWLTTRPKPRHLHYISIEKYPVSAEDLAYCHSRLDLPEEFSRHLIQQYPIAVEGYHRIHFKEHSITLTLIFGDAQSWLKKSEFQANAWYLDGFSPNKNPDLWDLDIARQVYRLTCAHGTLSTYSAASSVRKNFTDAGFSMEKRAGFGQKREMLAGKKFNHIACSERPLKQKNWLNSPPAEYANKTAIVIGAGMAGCFISAALAQRSWNVTLIDKNDSVATEGSGNPNAILMPRLTIDHDAQSQLTLQGYLYTLRYLAKLSQEYDFNWSQCGAIQIPRDASQWQRMQKFNEKYDIPGDLLTPVNRAQASELAGCEVAYSGWHIPQAGWLKPAMLCNSLINQHGPRINFINHTFIESMRQNDYGWAVKDSSNNEYSADIVILTSALAVDQYSYTKWCSLNPKRGQLSIIPQHCCNLHPKKIICADAYLTPQCDSMLIAGATFITNDSEIDIRAHEHETNLDKLSVMLPQLRIKENCRINGRAAIRAVSNDRLPVIGPVSIKEAFYQDFMHAALGAVDRNYPLPKTYKGLYIASGFGSRGLAWIPLCAEALASIINNEPAPIDNGLQQAIHPNRFLMKKLLKLAK